MRFIKSILYRLGKRPKRGSIFYSPTLDLMYAWKEATPFIRDMFAVAYSEGKGLIVDIENADPIEVIQPSEEFNPDSTEADEILTWLDYYAHVEMSEWQRNVIRNAFSKNEDGSYKFNWSGRL